MIFTFLLVLLGIFFLCYSLFLCRKMILVYEKPIHKRAGRIMLSLIVIFFFGYVMYMLYNYEALFTDFLVSLLLFLTAFFIMLVLHVNHSLIIRLTMKNLELKQFSEELLAQAQAEASNKERLEAIKSMLEDKSKEVEGTLNKVSSSQIELAKSTAIAEAKKESAESETHDNPDLPSEPGSNAQ
jgi:hypothetical protein